MGRTLDDVIARIGSFLIVSACLSFGAGGALGQDAPAGEREADHEALRELRRVFVEAINSRDLEAIRPLLTESFTFTTVDNKKLVGAAELESHWERLFGGEDPVLESMEVSPEADALTEFLGEGVGVAQGSSADSYDFVKLGTREMASRWTAVVVNDGGGWKVSKVHMSGNILDNPVLDGRAKLANAKALLAFLVGIAAGAVGSALVARRRRPAAQ